MLPKGPGVLVQRAAQSLTAGWVHLTYVNTDGVMAKVVDRDVVFTVTQHNGVWQCSCPYFGGQASFCVHAAAVARVTAPL